MSDRRYIGLAEVVERYAGTYSKYTVYELTRSARIPHRKFRGCRSIVFPLDELEAWEDGCDLEHVQLPDGGRVVRPVSNGRRP